VKDTTYHEQYPSTKRVRFGDTSVCTDLHWLDVLAVCFESVGEIRLRVEVVVVGAGAWYRREETLHGDVA